MIDWFRGWLDVGGAAESAIDWLRENVGGAFDAVGEVLGRLVGDIRFFLELPPVWLGIVLFAAIPLVLRRWGLAVFTVLAFGLIEVMDLWAETLVSLAIVLVATVLAAAVGVPLGVWAARRRAVSVAIRPVLDLLQTTPPFVYLIPAVFFFGLGVVPGVVATVVFALAPAVRLTELGIRQVDSEVVEAAHAFGSRPSQLLREVQLPLALPTIMAGINQVIMLALSMVVVAGLVGAGGLGAVVTGAVANQDVAAGVEGGLAVVILAIYLDRVTSALADPSPRWRRAKGAVSESDQAEDTKAELQLVSGGVR